MDTNRLHERWNLIRKNKKFSKDYRMGWLQQIMTFAERMPDVAFTQYMQEILGEDWIQILEEHGLMEETKDA